MNVYVIHSKKPKKKNPSMWLNISANTYFTSGFFFPCERKYIQGYKNDEKLLLTASD